MAYSVMVWLVNPGHQAHEEEETEWATAGRDEAPGATFYCVAELSNAPDDTSVRAL
jgi:hypothetical protein